MWLPLPNSVDAHTSFNLIVDRQKIRERNQGDREKDINNDIARELEKERARTQRASKLKRLNKY